jgi:hypothetical protein
MPIWSFFQMANPVCEFSFQERNKYNYIVNVQHPLSFGNGYFFGNK